MKILLSIKITILILLSVVTYSFYLHNTNIKNIKKAVIVIENKTSNLNGSGLIVKKNDHYFLLTNKHVCKPNNYEKEDWVFHNNDNYYYEEIHNNQKFHMLNYDVCFVKLKSKFYNLNHFYSVDYKVNSIVKLFLNKTNNLNHLTQNRTSKLIIQKGKYLKTLKAISFLNTSSSKVKVIKQQNSSVTNIKIIQGDSGSPLFNDYGELVGIAFGTKYKCPLPVNILDRDSEAKIVKHSYFISSKYFLNALQSHDFK